MEKTNDITTLRDSLFDTLNALKDKNSPMDLDRAKMISDVAQTIINSAKVEVDYLKATGGFSSSGFLDNTRTEKKTPNITVHKMIG